VPSKSRLLGILALLVLAAIFLRPGEEASDSSDQGGKPESAIDRHLRPREPAFVDPERQYGIARRSDMIRSPRDTGRQAAPYSHVLSGGAYSSAPYAGSAPSDARGYRYRPLTEREQKRMEKASAQEGGYAMPYGPSGLYQAGPAGGWPPAAPEYGFADRDGTKGHADRRDDAETWRDPWGRAYSFRPLEDRPAAARRADARVERGRDGVDGYGYRPPPFRAPAGGSDRYTPAPYATDPTKESPGPEWGATPPGEGMYPSLEPFPERRMSGALTSPPFAQGARVPATPAG